MKSISIESRSKIFFSKFKTGTPNAFFAFPIFFVLKLKGRDDLDCRVDLFLFGKDSELFSFFVLLSEFALARPFLAFLLIGDENCRLVSCLKRLWVLELLLELVFEAVWFDLGLALKSSSY